MAKDPKAEIRAAEERLLEELRSLRRNIRGQSGASRPKDKLTIGQQFADWIAAGMGSWPFIIVQSVILFFWIVLNVTAFVFRWDPYPFILLNLALSFQAAYAAPIIMMSQNRQSDIDRKKAENDYNVNIKAELEIELLHQKIDELREKQMDALTQAVADLTQHVKNEGLAAAKTTSSAKPAPAEKPAPPAKTAKPRTSTPRSARAKRS